MYQLNDMQLVILCFSVTINQMCSCYLGLLTGMKSYSGPGTSVSLGHLLLGAHRIPIKLLKVLGITQELSLRLSSTSRSVGAMALSCASEQAAYCEHDVYSRGLIHTC